MALKNEIDNMRREIRTDGYDMSIGEWISLYEKNEIDIHPEFQRFYRWSERQKSNLIESILLGIPIPPIFVSQKADGVWDVVDGLQRLSTIYNFVGILKNEDGNPLPPLILNRTKYLPSLEGKKWNDPGSADNSFTQAERLIVKRTKLSASIILKESDETAKYDLFQRLNTGGSDLTDQEVRNCILVMMNRTMYKWIKSLADYDAFQEAISLSDRPLEEQYDLELVLRFLLFVDLAEDRLKQLNDLGTFLTDQMVAIAGKKQYDFTYYEKIFKHTFDLILKEAGSDAFRKYSKAKSKFLGGFSVSAFEVVAMGVGFNIFKETEYDVDILTKIKDLWEDSTFISSSRSGTSAARRIPSLIPFGRGLFES
ncbi:MAG: DUF262 domain-containing protein [Syntrophaceae bacterium]|nr:DUF262 domain-containing protein [Syntrophaceae bacterium]